MRCLFLFPFIAILALHLLLSPPPPPHTHTHMEGPVHLLPMVLRIPVVRRMRKRYFLPSPLQTQKQARP